MSTPETFLRLLQAPGPSGREAAASAVFREAASSFADEVEGDLVGSSTARVKGKPGDRTLAIVGHIDEIGLIVSHIEEKGFLRFQQVGGWDPVVLIGQRVAITGRDGKTVPGVIARKPIHLMETDERGKSAKIKDLHIDIGANDADDAKTLIRVGDVGVIAVDPLDLPNGRLASRAMDNRVGCFVALEAARLVSEAGGAAFDVVAVAASQEETSLGGAKTVTHRLRPDVAIAVDVTFATDQPGVTTGELTDSPLGSGPSITRGTNLHPVVSDGLVETAEANKIEHTLAAEGRGTSTDADAINISRDGVPTGLVSVPLRYMHSPVEVVQISDIEAAARLIADYALSLPADIDFNR
ncbi:MAG: M20/M25/M40 family metallo-hydrolase [Actinomycetes bacterium]|nr:M20/M25/M40 family metallo-hydrolase [Solirubrobacterales bacterium]